MAKKLDTNLKLLIALVVLGGAAAAKHFLGGKRYETGETAQASETMFSGFKKDDITALLIEGPEGKKAELVKDGDHWKVVSEANARADKADVERVLGGIEKMKKGKVASSSGSNLERFNLDASKAVKVTAYGVSGKSGSPVADFSLGKNSDDWKTAFVKLPSETSVRRVEASSADFEPGYDNTWRDKVIFDDGPGDKVTEVEITGPTGAVVLKRENVMGPKEKMDDAPPPGTDADPSTPPIDPSAPTAAAASGQPELEVKEVVWNLLAPTAGKAKKWLCDSIANNLAKLECDSFFDGKETLAELGLEPPAYSCKVRREGDAEAKTRLLVGNKNKDGKYAVKLADGPTIWWLASWKGDSLIKSADELLDTPPPPPTPAPAEPPAEPSTENTAEPPPADGVAPASTGTGGTGGTDNPKDETSGGTTPPADPPKPDDGG